MKPEIIAQILYWLGRCFCGCCADIADIPDQGLIYLDQITPTIFTDTGSDQSYVPQISGNSNNANYVFTYEYTLDQPDSSGS